jgi:hypothetical protein
MRNDGLTENLQDQLQIQIFKKRNLVLFSKNDDSWYVPPCGRCITDVWEEYIASFIRAKRFSELGTRLAVTSNSDSEFMRCWN